MNRFVPQARVAMLIAITHVSHCSEISAGHSGCAAWDRRSVIPPDTFDRLFYGVVWLIVRTPLLFRRIPR